MNTFIHKIWWVWIPVIFILLHIVGEPFLPPTTKERILEEGGFHEGLQALVMLCALILAVRLLNNRKNIWLRLWFGIAAFGAFYVTGEEISWGQWILHWTTPETWSSINDQNETNLHNISNWFDQIPFSLLSIGALVGGLIIPVLQRYMPMALPDRFTMIYGDYRLIPTTLIALFLKLTDTFNDATGTSYFWRISEVLELYIYYFVFLYLLIMTKKHQDA